MNLDYDAFGGKRNFFICLAVSAALVVIAFFSVWAAIGGLCAVLSPLILEAAGVVEMKREIVDAMSNIIVMVAALSILAMGLLFIFWVVSTVVLIFL